LPRSFGISFIPIGFSGSRHLHSGHPTISGCGAATYIGICGAGSMTMTLRDRIRAKLADLKLPGALAAVDDVLARADGGGISAAGAINSLLDAQIELRRRQRCLESAKNSARLPHNKTLADFDFSMQPGIDRNQIMSLHELDFVRRRENLVLCGPPGVGKTHLCVSLARWLR